jgi:hypothetical protein
MEEYVLLEEASITDPFSINDEIGNTCIDPFFSVFNVAANYLP